MNILSYNERGYTIVGYITDQGVGRISQFKQSGDNPMEFICKWKITMKCYGQ